MVVTFLEFIKSLGWLPFQKAVEPFQPFLKGFILHHEMLPHENSRAEPLQGEGCLGRAHTPTECCRQGEGRALGEGFASLCPAHEGLCGFPSLYCLPHVGQENLETPQCCSTFPSCCPAQQLDPEQHVWAAVTAAWAQLSWYRLSAGGRDNDSFQG